MVCDRCGSKEGKTLSVVSGHPIREVGHLCEVCCEQWDKLATAVYASFLTGKVCHACHRDLSGSNARYPYDEDGITQDRLIPLGMAIDGDGKHRPIVCFHCFHCLQPDMWITEECWKALDPKTPWAELPNGGHRD